MKLDSEKLSIQTTITIPFHDIDVMEIAWHGHYVKYAEIARHELLKHIGYDYPDMVKSGFAWPIIEIKLRYIRPSYYGMKLSIHAKLKEIQNRLLIEYLMTNPKGEKVCKGHSIQVAVNAETQEMLLASPPILHESIQKKLSS